MRGHEDDHNRLVYSMSELKQGPRFGGAKVDPSSSEKWVDQLGDRAVIPNREARSE
jgi:hypothetical protein